MAKIYNVNTDRFSPYATFRFLVYFGESTEPVAVVSKVSGLKRTTSVIEFNEGGNALTRKSPGRTKYESVKLERGLTQNSDFEDWANSTQVLDKGAAQTSLKNLRKEVRIELCDESGQPSIRYVVHRAWVSEYSISDFDAGANATAIEHVTLEHEGVERDTSLAEPAEA